MTTRKTMRTLGLSSLLAAWSCACPQKMDTVEPPAPPAAEAAPAIQTPPDAQADGIARAAEVPPGPPPMIATPPPDAPPPTVSALRAYFDEAPLDDALRSYLAGDNVAAAEAFAAFAVAHSDDVRARPARFMALLARHDGGVWTPTAADLEAMADEWPALADYAWFYAGSAHAQAERRPEAEAALARVPVRSTLWGRAQELRARSLLASGDQAQARAVLEAAVLAAPDDRSANWLMLATLRGALGDAPGRDAALLEVAVRWANAAEGREALASLGKKPKLDVAQRFRLGEALHDAHEHGAALKHLGLVPKGDARYCDAQYLMARVREKMKQHAEVWKALSRLVERCEGEVHAKATFVAGRNRLRAGDLDAAERLLTLHVETHPTETTVDDALLMLAAVHRGRGEAEAANAALMRIVKDHPRGDMQDEAAWDLVWPHIEAKRWEEALATLDTVLASLSGPTGYRDEAQRRYWRGRVLLHLGRDAEAMAAWRDVVRDYPLSWYGLLAYGRLHAQDATAARAFAAEVAATVPAAEQGPGPAIPEALWRDPGLHRAVELARMGLADSAARELEALKDPPGAADEWAWAKAALYQTAEAWPLAARLARRKAAKYGRVWPNGRHAQVWRISYPKPYRGLVERWAAEREIDPHWVWAIMRVESNFNPKAVSWANAIGLMQIILPTAEFLAKGTDIAPTRENLEKPEVAVELSTKYLAKLLESHPWIPLASAGYNAGGGRIRQWRREFGDVEIDEFVERMPFAEAKGYTRSVTETFARYSYLYGGGEILLIEPFVPGAPD